MVMSVFSSLQFLFLGIIGLYIGKMMRETKHRPVFIVQNDCTGRQNAQTGPRNPLTASAWAHRMAA